MSRFDNPESRFKGTRFEGSRWDCTGFFLGGSNLNEVSRIGDKEFNTRFNYDEMPAVKMMLTEDILFHVGKIAVGTISVASGFVLTVGTFGAATVVGGALIGAGANSLIGGSMDLYNQKSLDGGLVIDTVIDLTIGAATGAITAGVAGAIESYMLTEKFTEKAINQGLTVGAKKLIIRVAIQGGLGLINTGANEFKVCLTNEKDWIDFGQSNNGALNSILIWVTGAAAGAIAGASQHATNNIMHRFDFVKGYEGIQKCTIRMSMSIVTSAGSNLLAQGIRQIGSENKKFQLSELVMNALMAGAFTMAAESAKQVVYFVNGGKMNYLNRMAINQKVDKEFIEDAKLALKEIDKIDKKELNRLFDRARKYISDLNNHETKTEKLKNLKDYLESKLGELTNQIKQESSRQLKSGIQQQREGCRSELARVPRFIGIMDQSKINRDHYCILVGDRNAHFLAGEGIGLFAIDVDMTSDVSNRGNSRIVFDVISDQNNNLKFLYRGFLKEHVYGKVLDKNITGYQNRDLKLNSMFRNNDLRHFNKQSNFNFKDDE